MAFTLTTAQRAELQTLRDSFPATTDPSYSDALNYFEMYELLLSYVDAFEDAGNTLTQDEVVSKIWLEGVIAVNRGDTAQSDFIRIYNSKQSELRFDKSLSETELNTASDDIALDVINTVLSNLEGNLPNIEDLAAEDVNTVSTELLNEESSAWAGNPLLLFLNYSDTYTQNIIGDGTDAYDFLAMSQITYETLLEVAFSPLDAAFFFTPGGIFGSDAFELIWGAGNAAFYSEAQATITAAISDSLNLIDTAYNIEAVDLAEYILTNDLILGSEGNDTLAGTDNVLLPDDELIHGGDGDDTLLGGTGNDILDGGAGEDTISYAGSEDGVSINFQTGTVVVGNETKDYIHNFENAVGTNETDFLFGDAGDNVLNGGAGNDVLEGFGGTDTFAFTGNFGHDTVLGGEKIVIDDIEIDGSGENLTFNEYNGGLLISKGLDNSVFIGDWVEDGAYGITPQEQGEEGEMGGVHPAFFTTENQFFVRSMNP